MATAQDVVTAALQELGVLAAGETASAEDAALALARLNEMLAAWELSGIAHGVPTLALATTIATPDSHIEAMRTGLAVRIAPAFGVAASDTTRGLAAEGERKLRVAYRSIPRVSVDPALRRRTIDYWGVLR